MLVTTLTKKMAEDLTDYLLEIGHPGALPALRGRHLARVELLRQLRLGDYDVLIGINLLREGLDLPEVSLVAILDADKEGFLRSSAQPDPDHRPHHPQRIRRSAHVRRQDDRFDERGDRRDRGRQDKQIAYNEANGIDPQPLRKKIADISTRSIARLRSRARPSPVGGSGRNARAGANQGGPGRAVSAGVFEGRDARACRGPNWPI